VAWRGAADVGADEADAGTALHQGFIEEQLFAIRRDLFSDLAVAFLDTTTLYFEGRGGETLGQNGKTKDYRPHLKQMIVGIVMDQDGWPVCSEMWSGTPPM
jgi:transposase